MLYVPAARFEADADEPPEGDHAYVYGDVPPLALIAAEPSFAPLHVTFENAATDAFTIAGAPTTTDAVDVHPCGSVTVTV